jgi:hypothetical protein
MPILRMLEMSNKVRVSLDPIRLSPGRCPTSNLVDTVGQPDPLRPMNLRRVKVNLEVVDRLLPTLASLLDRLKVSSPSHELDPEQLIMFKLVVQFTLTDPIQAIRSPETALTKRRSHKVIMLLLAPPTTTSLSDSKPTTLRIHSRIDLLGEVDSNLLLRPIVRTLLNRDKIGTCRRPTTSTAPI